MAAKPKPSVGVCQGWDGDSEVLDETAFSIFTQSSFHEIYRHSAWRGLFRNQDSNYGLIGVLHY